MTESVQARALATFQSQYGFVRQGQIFTSERTYAEEMALKKNVEIITGNPQPQRRQAFAGAPYTAGKGPATALPPLSSHDSAAVQDSGAARPASSLPLDRRSQRKTSTTRKAKHA